MSFSPPFAKTFLAAHAEDFTTSLFRLYHLRFEIMEHGGEYPDTMPQAIKFIDTEGRSCIYERADGPAPRSDVALRPASRFDAAARFA